MECSATLKATETDCYACGARVLKGDDPTLRFAKRFNSTVTVVFFICSGFTVAALFLDSMPPVSHCASVTGIVGLVRHDSDNISLILENASTHFVEASRTQGSGLLCRSIYE